MSCGGAERAETAGKPLVIGYGNPLRGDDGVGWAVVEKLSERIGPQQAELMAVHLLTPELAEPISRAGEVIFIDAAEGPEAGQIAETFVAPREFRQSMVHQLSPESLLSLARDVFGRCPPAKLYTIGGADFGHWEGLSEAVGRAADELANRLI